MYTAAEELCYPAWQQIGECMRNRDPASGLDPALLIFFNESFFTLPPKKNEPISQPDTSIRSTLENFANVLQTKFPSLKPEHINNLRSLDFQTSPNLAWTTPDDQKQFREVTLSYAIPTIIASLQSGKIPITKSEPEIQDLLTNGLKENVCYAGKLVNIENVAKKLDACSNLQSKFMMAREQTIRDLLIKQFQHNPAMQIHEVSEILYTHEAFWGIQPPYDSRSAADPTITRTSEIAARTKIQVPSLLPSAVLFYLTQDIAQSQPHLIFDMLSAYGDDPYYPTAGPLLDDLHYYTDKELPVRSWAAEHYLFLCIYYRFIEKGYCNSLHKTGKLKNGITITYLPASANIDNSVAFCHVETADHKRTPLIVYVVDALFEGNEEAIDSIDFFLQNSGYPIKNSSQLLEEKEIELIAAFSQIQDDPEKDYSRINCTLLDKIIPQKQNEFWKNFIKKVDDIEMNEMQMISALRRVSYDNLGEVILSKNNFNNTFFCAILNIREDYASTYVKNCIANAEPEVAKLIISTVKNKNIKILEKIFEENILERQSKEAIIKTLRQNGIPTPAINPLKISDIISLKKANLLFIYGAPVEIDDSKTMRCIHWMHVCNDPEVTAELSTEEHRLFFTRYLELFENALKKENHVQIQTFFQDEEIVANMLSNEKLLKQARLYFEKESTREDSLICLVETMITSSYAAYTTAQRKEYKKFIENIKKSNALQEKILQYENEISDGNLAELADEVISRIENDQCSPVLRKFSTAVLRNNLQSKASRKLLKALCSHTKKAGKDLYPEIKESMKKCQTSKSVLNMCHSLLKKDGHFLYKRDNVIEFLHFNPAIMFLLKKRSISYDTIWTRQRFFENFSVGNSDFKIIEFICAHGGARSFSLDVVLRAAVFKNFLDHIKENEKSILISNLDLESNREEFLGRVNMLSDVGSLTLALQHNKISPLSIEEIMKICENKRISDADIEELMQQIDKETFHSFFSQKIMRLDTLTEGQKRIAKYIDINTFTLWDSSLTALDFALQSKSQWLVNELFQYFKSNTKNLLLASKIFSITPKNQLTELFNQCYASSIFEALKTNQYNLLEECMDQMDGSEPKLRACTKVLDIISERGNQNIEAMREMFARYCNDKFSKYKNQIEIIFEQKNQKFMQALMHDALSRKIKENAISLFSSHYFIEFHTNHKEYIKSLIPSCDRIARGSILMHACINQDSDMIDQLLNSSPITDQPSFDIIKEEFNGWKRLPVPAHFAFSSQLRAAIKTKNVKMIHQMMDMGMIIVSDYCNNDMLVAALEYSITMIEGSKIIKDLDQYLDQDLDIFDEMRLIKIGDKKFHRGELIKSAINLKAGKALEMLIRPLRGDFWQCGRMMFSTQDWCDLKLLLADPADAQMLRPAKLNALEKNLKEYIEVREKESGE